MKGGLDPLGKDQLSLGRGFIRSCGAFQSRDCSEENGVLPQTFWRIRGSLKPRHIQPLKRRPDVHIADIIFEIQDL
jgi:hypothetical protein